MVKAGILTFWTEFGGWCHQTKILPRCFQLEIFFTSSIENLTLSYLGSFEIYVPLLIKDKFILSVSLSCTLSHGLFHLVTKEVEHLSTSGGSTGAYSQKVPSQRWSDIKSFISFAYPRIQRGLLNILAVHDMHLTFLLVYCKTCFTFHVDDCSSNSLF